MAFPHTIIPTRTFLEQSAVEFENIAEGDIAIFGAAYGTPYPTEAEVAYELVTGSAHAPDAIRTAACESSSNIDHYDFDLGGPLLADNSKKLVDCGDLILEPEDAVRNRAAIQQATSAILEKKAVPFLLGGDDSVPIPFLRAFAENGPIDILQLDAHIDWRDSIGGIHDGYSSTIRRAAECGFVRSITQVGMRGVGSARNQEVSDALAWGARLIAVTEARSIGTNEIIAAIPHGGNLVIQIDCDVFDTSVCPAVNAPTPGGFRFEEVSDIVQKTIAARGLAGFSIVELAPKFDVNQISATVAARITCNAMGALCRFSDQSRQGSGS
ncbi:arginase family protein [Roseobacter weihaiensis]|uniref:arginase family protein n=1 Tax=Roseobacter weihaiensis TaxID=2763262 RepID=UPI001D09E1B6|nr:arginase family protein [Roseobacter sp. H9]